MKKYRLKQWYPSLYDDIEVGTIVDYENGWIYYTNKRGNKMTMGIDEEELSYEDFWELVEEKEPLFITEDGVDIFLGHSYILIDKEFIKHKQTASNIVYTEYFKKFKHEPNADTYIWKNKPVFSYNDVMEFINLRLYTKETIEHDAKERSKE